MHEILFRSLGGKVSKTNSIAVCGSGTTLCHGYLQAKQVAVDVGPLWAEETLTFRPLTRLAAEHMKIKVGESIVSPPMRETEISA